MLRITKVERRTGSVTLIVEGPITSEDVALLELDCVRLLQAGRRVRLDLADVDFVDHTGVAALRELIARDVEIERTSLTVERLLTRGTRSTRLRCPDQP